MSTEVDQILELLGDVARGDSVELDPFLFEVASDVEVRGTNTKCHVRVVTLNGNGICRVADLMKYMQHTLIEYAIPRSQIKEALEHQERTGSAAQIGRIASEAKELFADVEKSGEGGELLLYLLAERYLGLPQLLCKMDLKTSSNMHFHGSDGLHVGPGSAEKLALYWGESKIYSSFGSAVSSCLESLAPLLTDPSSFESRDLQLLGRYMDFADSKLEGLLKQFLDPATSLFNSVEFRGLCLVGFDSNLYPVKPNDKKLADLVSDCASKVADWVATIGAKSKALKIDTYYIHFFCLPVPSAKNFRSEFRVAFGGANNGDS